MMMSRRRVLQLGIASSLSGGMSGCAIIQPTSCPIAWVPSVISPVFYGYADYVASSSRVGLCINQGGSGTLGRRIRPTAPPSNPLAVRVYFPSLDGSPQNASLLSGCFRFPLVIFVHGDCGGNPFEQWVDIPAQLARSGYIVAVTNYGGRLATGDPSDTMNLHLVYDWIRNCSPYAGNLMPSPNTAVMGHSYGGTLAAQLSAELPTTAYASLSGEFGESTFTTTQPKSIATPSLFLWVTGATSDEILIGSTNLWPQVRTPTHAVAFVKGHHGDYMQPGSGGSCDQSGPCPWVRPLTADFLTAFLSKYMPPEAAALSPSSIPNSLFMPPGSEPLLSQQQQFYAGSYLIGFAASKTLTSDAKPTCMQNVFWRMAGELGATNLTQ